VWPREEDSIEVEIENDDGDTVWQSASVTAVLVDGWFKAKIVTIDDEWEDWFTWQEEGTDWRRAKHTPVAIIGSDIGSDWQRVEQQQQQPTAGNSPALKKKPGPVADGGGRKRLGELRRCGACKGCVRADDCGECKACKDKPKFGGPGTKKQRCKLRACSRPKELESDHAPSMGTTTAAVTAGSKRAREDPDSGEGEILDAEDADEPVAWPVVLPTEPPPLSAPACKLPACFTVAKRPADLPPWASRRDGPGPHTKSMCTASMRRKLCAVG
jgi:hypothetical protein